MNARNRLAAQSELTYLKVARRMRIAMQIADAMEKRHISKKELAEMTGHQPSEITKWLSGDQNFTSDTLAELSYYLQTKITGEDPVYTFTYITVSYDSSLTVELPSAKVCAPLNTRRQWKKLSDQPIATLRNN